MIRYPIHPRALEARIQASRAGWLARASQRTAGLIAAGRYNESSGIWSEIKRPYMQLQGFKCGFCERRLENSPYGNIEHDVEHFRPKARVDEWPTEAIRRDRGVSFDFALGGDEDPGYFRLAYHPENYLIACKTCNTALKRNFFPIEGIRDTTRDRSRNLKAEKPLLLYPIGASDADPEDVITFRGIVPIPVATRGHQRRRALVTIQFFELASREILVRERAEIIITLHLAMMLADHEDPLTRRAATRAIDMFTSREAAHANCARAHHDLILHEPLLAREFTEEALAWLEATA